MNTIFSTPAAAQGAAGHSGAGGMLAILGRWWVAYLTRRIEQVAITRLHSMSDRELKDIGLTRSQIMGAVRGEIWTHPLHRYH